MLQHHPLVINVSYDAPMSVTSCDFETSYDAQVGLARRLLASYFGIPWPDAQTLELPNTPYMVAHTLDLLVAHHKKKRGLKDSDQVVVLLNVDSLDRVFELLRESEDQAVHMVGTLLKELRRCSMEGVAVRRLANRCPVLPLVASSDFQQLIAAAQRGNILLEMESLPPLSEEDTFAALRGCGVDDRYLQHPEFVDLLSDTGGVPGLVRLAMEGLTVDYDASRIAHNRARMEQYLKVRLPALGLDVVRELLPVVLLGKTRHPGAAVAETSPITYSDLQRRGLVWLAGDPDAVSSYHVIVPPMLLRAICDQHLQDFEVAMARHLLIHLARLGRESYQSLLACYLALLNRTLSHCSDGPITLGRMYPRLEMHRDLAAVAIEFSTDKDYQAWPLCPGEGIYRFPPREDLRDEPVAQDHVDCVAQCLLLGAVESFGEGAEIDILQVDPLCWGGLLVRAFRVLDPGTKLTLRQLNADRARMQQAVAGCEQLAALRPGGKVKCVTVHVTDGVVNKATQRPLRDAIVIGQHNLEAFFGPVVARCLSFNRRRQAAEAAAAQVAEHKAKKITPKGPRKKTPQARGYCTLRISPTAVKIGAMPPLTSAHRLALAARMLFRIA